MAYGLTGINSIVKTAFSLVADVAPRLDIGRGGVIRCLECRADSILAGPLNRDEYVTTGFLQRPDRVAANILNGCQRFIADLNGIGETASPYQTATTIVANPTSARQGNINRRCRRKEEGGHRNQGKQD
ncbi:hypothetical protein [Sinorhizobium medicae]